MEGVSGLERYRARDGGETEERFYCNLCGGSVTVILCTAVACKPVCCSL